MDKINIPEFLADFYKEEAIHTRMMEQLEGTKIRMHYVFSPYQRTIEPMDHVGMSQMNEAMVEGLYCCIGNAIKQEAIESPIDVQTFQNIRGSALFMRENIEFRKMMKAGEEATLELSVKDVKTKLRGKYYAVTCIVEGFMRGEAECWLAVEDSTQ